jgi:hypothetical protein
MDVSVGLGETPVRYHLGIARETRGALEITNTTERSVHESIVSRVWIALRRRSKFIKLYSNKCTLCHRFMRSEEFGALRYVERYMYR